METKVTVSSQSQVKYPIKKIIKERCAEIIAGGNGGVFYNPVQEFNRDLSITVINCYFQYLLKERQEKMSNGNNQDTVKQYSAAKKYEDGLRILEALSATGLRSIRYAKEVAGVKEIIANDLSKHAVEAIRDNVKHNKVEHLIEVSHADATTLMYLSTALSKQFDCIDLDPYGCPNRFLDAAIQSLKNGGLLLVTATDMAVLAGNAPEACYVKYGSVPLRMKSCHEMALRIVLHCVESYANRYGKYCVPLLSISADFYVRVFVRIFNSQAKCKFSMSKQSMIYQCTGCSTFNLQPLGSIKPNHTETQPKQVKFGIPTGPPVNTHCEHCGQKHHLGGPVWSAPIHDNTFVQSLIEAINKAPLSELSTQKRLNGMLTMVLEELPDVPLYYTLDKLCCVLKLEIIPILKFRTALLYAGYRVSFSHAYKNSIKTDAPASVIWDILRCWNKRHPVKEERMINGTPLKEILSKPCENEYNFDDLHPEANPKSRKDALSRFQANPTAFWGPGTRATIMVGEDKLAKSYRNQNKKQKYRPQENIKGNELDDQQKSKQPKIDETLGVDEKQQQSHLER
ncbi:probable tRNA (guanine(26)-N(2))-dimethyltransferase isoform X1 [Glossina fuscipes]|uniref:tRNA (guanine(26)-N(2))-dimethyltransferase n=1 Tax=Glossina fuscipes TaxID=7396 RepID=A0A8U0WAC1_9MUSC|nr:probable tRNA (guanine(26)-N(2))-dimethyltransferase isoform X1 [Glossina fuscipes]